MSQVISVTPIDLTTPAADGQGWPRRILAAGSVDRSSRDHVSELGISVPLGPGAIAEAIVALACKVAAEGLR